MNLKIVIKIILVFLLIITPTVAGNQIWKRIRISDNEQLQDIVKSCNVIAVIKYDENKGEALFKLLKGKELDQKPIITRNCYNAHKLLDGNSGELYCMYFSKIDCTSKTSVQQQSKTFRLSWNKIPTKIPIRAITGERRKKINHSNPEFYITIKDIEEYLQVKK